MSWITRRDKAKNAKTIRITLFFFCGVKFEPSIGNNLRKINILILFFCKYVTLFFLKSKRFAPSVDNNMNIIASYYTMVKIQSTYSIKLK